MIYVLNKMLNFNLLALFICCRLHQHLNDLAVGEVFLMISNTMNQKNYLLYNNYYILKAQVGFSESSVWLLSTFSSSPSISTKYGTYYPCVKETKVFTIEHSILKKVIFLYSTIWYNHISLHKCVY